MDGRPGVFVHEALIAAQHFRNSSADQTFAKPKEWKREQFERERDGKWLRFLASVGVDRAEHVPIDRIIRIISAARRRTHARMMYRMLCTLISAYHVQIVKGKDVLLRCNHAIAAVRI